MTINSDIGHGKSRSFKRSFSSIIIIILTLANSAITLQASEKTTVTVSGLRITFVNGTDQLVSEGQKIIAQTAAHFEEVFRRPVEKASVRIRFVDRHEMGEMVRFEEVSSPSGRKIVSLQMVNIRGLKVWSSGCKLQGMTLGEKGVYEIKISNQRNGSFGRVLAHEITHVLVRQAYGNGENLLLNEGIAEYLAEKEFQSEVQQDLQRSSKSSKKDLKPYVEGFNFCNRHAAEAYFADFFEAQLDNNIRSSQALEEKWQRSQIKL